MHNVQTLNREYNSMSDSSNQLSSSVAERFISIVKSSSNLFWDVMDGLITRARTESSFAVGAFFFVAMSATLIYMLYVFFKWKERK